jgi:hypothetical protein
MPNPSMNVALKTHQQANILLHLLSAEISRLDTEIKKAKFPTYGIDHLKNELDAVESLYKAVYNASTTPNNRIQS